jgi:AraC family transcriptional regulator
MFLMSSAPLESGRLRRSRNTRSAILRESVYPAGLVMPRHAHEPCHFSVVLGGGFEERMGSKSWSVQPGSVIYRPAESEHTVSFASVQTTVLSIQLGFSLTEYARDSKVPVRQPADLSNAKARWLVARLQDEFSKDDLISDLAVDALVLEMLVELGRSKHHAVSDAKIRRVDERIRENLHLKPSLDELAKEVGMHPVSLARAFKRCHQMTIGECIRRIRLEEATRLLTTSNLSLAEIAQELGFSDQSHFCRTFKAETGVTPRLCQRTHLKG